MHRVPAAQWLSRALRMGDAVSRTGVPVFLCPAMGLSRAGRQPSFTKAAASPQRFNHTEAGAAVACAPADADNAFPVPDKPARALPVTCSGCGAFAQTADPQQLGHFDLQSKRVRLWLHPRRSSSRAADAAADDVVNNVLRALDPEKLQELGLSAETLFGDGDEGATTAFMMENPPVCDRCHDLTHHSAKTSTAKVAMYHPTVESLRETIEESPYKYNHIYHVIDAADFPMSLIPRLNVLLGDIALRSKNRRSRSGKFQNDRKTEMSFIITRSDLLGPTKEIVDSMMPYLREVLRDALGRLGDRVRLGNLRCVSARRGWWTRDVKEDVWDRGGAGWMVGKVNVGKSQLFEAIYPKGRMGEDKKMSDGNAVSARARTTGAGRMTDHEVGWRDLDVGELLPPAQPATNFPKMPLVSPLPGTTTSPIRIPFGNGKGELIDLPGLARSDLELFVKEEDRDCLVMKRRIVPTQCSTKSTKSMLLGGGLIRFTPRTPGLTFLMYNFTPLEEHLTHTEKAITFQNQTHESIGVPSIMAPGVGDKMKHAGTFRLCHDVTKNRAGPLTRKNAVGLQVDRLPFRVVSVDILIEGVGYVEVVAQVRSRDYERWSDMQQERDRALALAAADVDATRSSRDVAHGYPASASDEGAPAEDPFEAMMRNRRDGADGGLPSARKVVSVPPEPDWPAVDVYTPEGRFVGSRRPIEGWVHNQPRVLAEHRRSRPRRSMKGVKKRTKEERRRAAEESRR